VKHALQLRQAIQQDNYCTFFKLYVSTPNMGAYILDLMVDNYRAQSLQRMWKSYKPDVAVAFVLGQLAFEDAAIGIDFMRRIGCVVEKDKTTGEFVWNTKDSVVDVSALQTQAKLLL
jgi:hypothetical protein